MTHIINGKEYSEFDINKRCAELMLDYEDIDYNLYRNDDNSINYGDGARWHKYRPCTSWNDAGPIIEKCWDELMRKGLDLELGACIQWERLIDIHNCTKLVAACICFIEVNE